MATKQPLERERKMIFVSIRYWGKPAVCLMPAVKVGNHYRVSHEAMDQWLNKLHIGRGQTFTLG